MSVIYIKEQGAYLQKKGERIAVVKNSKTLLEIAVDNIDDLALIGNVQLTTQALHMLLQRGVDISYFDFSGQYLGQTASESSKNIFLRFSQYELYHNEHKRLNIAKQIVENKVKNQIAVVGNYRWDGIDYDWKADIAQMKKVLKTLDEQETSNQILGVEGMCSNIYFKSYGHMFKSDCEFHGRNRRPPKDPINVIISLGYTFLTKEICSALEAESFEAYLGFLHGIRYGRKSLALDIIEEFRQPVVDRFALRLFNKRMITQLDFDIEEERIHLTEDGFKKFCKEYERWMTGNEFTNTDRSFRGIIKRQIGNLKRCIQKGEEYNPFSWEVQGNALCGKL